MAARRARSLERLGGAGVSSVDTVISGGGWVWLGGVVCGAAIG